MEVLQAISNRRSHRAYKKEQLPDEVLSAILKAGLEAPSARNRQPWHYSVFGCYDTSHLTEQEHFAKDIDY